MHRMRMHRLFWDLQTEGMFLETGIGRVRTRVPCKRSRVDKPRGSAPKGSAPRGPAPRGPKPRGPKPRGPKPIGPKPRVIDGGHVRMHAPADFDVHHDPLGAAYLLVRRRHVYREVQEGLDGGDDDGRVRRAHAVFKRVEEVKHLGLGRRPVQRDELEHLRGVLSSGMTGRCN
eukprot:363761-Chlamydomonas_euryale.AAC.33